MNIHRFVQTYTNLTSLKINFDQRASFVLNVRSTI